MKTYIIHVSTDFEREAHIKEEIKNINFDFVFINDGDKDSISENIAAKYFKGEMYAVSGATSCAYKHFLAYEDMIKNDIEYAVVLEDDIFLHKTFEKKIYDVLYEIKNRKLSNILISLEDSNQKFVKKSDIKKGQLLYANNRGRFTGAYMIDKKCAENLINEAKLNKCSMPIDHFHNYCAAIKSESNIYIYIYWLHPAIATQGSLNGKFASMIDCGRTKKSFLRTLAFYIENIYKKIVYKLR